MCTYVQWNLSIKVTLNRGHLSNEDTACTPNHIELCTNLPLNWLHLSINDSQLDPNGVHYREVPLYTLSHNYVCMYIHTYVCDRQAGTLYVRRWYCRNIEHIE